MNILNSVETLFISIKRLSKKGAEPCYINPTTNFETIVK